MSPLPAPDEGLFRSYYLTLGLEGAAFPGGSWSRLDERPAYEWLRACRRACQRRGVRFVLVVIPEAFQVDARMRRQWMPLTDMRMVTAPTRDAATRLLDHARADGMACVDLHEPLREIPGTCLNLDGHWSAKGVAEVATALAADVRDRLPD